MFPKRSFLEHLRLDFAMPRMNILNKSEQEMFDNPPVFDSSERKRFFNFPNWGIGPENVKNPVSVLYE
jgi:hypothetical protein